MQPSPPPCTDPKPHGHTKSPPASTLVIVRLKAPADTTAHQLRKVADSVREHFVAMPGLRRKYFSYCPERHEVVNVYVWHDGAAAARVRHPDFMAKVRAVYGGEPEVTFAEVLAIADAMQDEDGP